MTNISLFGSGPQVKPIEACITEAYASFGVPSLGGASLDGWSKLSDYQRCPYRYWALHLNEARETVNIGPKPVSLELGALFHACLACHYIGSVKEASAEYPTALELLERMRSLGGDTNIIDEASRLYIAYFNHYGNPESEGMVPLAIELPAGIEGIHTCRLDMLARRDSGLWIVEHKTASRETRDVLESWWLDGEIIGEVYGYWLSKLYDVYGPIVGVCVNVVIKTQTPKFRRIEVVIPESIIQRYAEDVAYWRSQREVMKKRGIERGSGALAFPRKLQGCIGRYDTCQLWDHCRDAESTDSERLQRLLKASVENAK